MNKLKEYKLNELYSMSSGISSTKEQAGHGFPFVTFRDIFNNIFIPENLTSLMDTSEDERQKCSVKKGDVFFTRTSETVDELAMSSVAIKDYPNATFSGFAKRLRPIRADLIYDKYMAFYFRSKYFRRIINANTIMTLRASFNDDIFSYIKVSIPEYEEQVKIGNFLYDIEEKIQKNTQINNNLEELMKTLYQRWFIEFNFPNEEGKPYKASGGKMVYNEELKRNIPENWNTDFISNYCSLISGYAFSSNDYVENGKYKLYTIKNVQDTGIESKVDNYIDNINDDMDQECLLKPSDIIMSLTGNVGRIGIVYDNNALLNQRVLKIKPNNGYYSYIYLLLKGKEMRSYLEKHSNGTSQKNLSPITIEKTKIVIPNEKIIEKFENIIRDYINSYIVNLQQNLKLIDFREFLLPMLMNGQINVDDIKI